nr:hypothetical protein Itr_chr11CG13320 [Ipomoea trifida]
MKPSLRGVWLSRNGNHLLPSHRTLCDDLIAIAAAAAPSTTTSSLSPPPSHPLRRPHRHHRRHLLLLHVLLTSASPARSYPPFCASTLPSEAPGNARCRWTPARSYTVAPLNPRLLRLVHHRVIVHAVNLRNLRNLRNVFPVTLGSSLCRLSYNLFKQPK